MAKIKLNIDGKAVTCKNGTTILQAARSAGIRIPSLCEMQEINHAPGACRMCVVEVEGVTRLLPSCTTLATEGMVVRTNSDTITATRKKTLDLMCKHHRMDCEYCPDYTFCELHALVRVHGLDDRIYSRVYHERKADESSPCIVRDNSKCILCRRCVTTCKVQGVSAIGALNRAENTKIGSVVSIDESVCVGCGQCVKNCPTGALFVKNDTDLIWKAFNNKREIIFGIMPSVATNIGRFFGEVDSCNNMGKVAAILKKIGVKEVYDLSGIALLGAEYAADMLKDSGVITTCPAVMKYRQDVKVAKGNDELFNRAAKEQHGHEIFTVYVSPCTAVKSCHDCDVVITTTELYELILRACVSRFTAHKVWEETQPVKVTQLPQINSEEIDMSLQDKVKQIFAKTGNEKTVETVFGCNPTVKDNAISFVFACPEGCKNGGGQFRTKGFVKKG